MLVYRSETDRSDAVKIAFVPVEGHATCSVWLTEVAQWATGPLKWCWADQEHHADLVVHIVDNVQWADVLVYQTPNEQWVQGTPPWA